MDRRLIIYGAGITANWIYSFLCSEGKEGQIYCFVEDDRYNIVSDGGIPVLPYSRVREMKDKY